MERHAPIASCHYGPRWLAAMWLSIGLLALLTVGACHTSRPVVDIGEKPPAARGTLTGTVRAADGSAAVAFANREITITNTENGERYTTRTARDGGFTMELPAGKYRLDLALRGGETLVKQPGIVDLGHGDIDSHIEFVLGVPRASHQSGPGYRVDNGLRAPMA